MKAKNIQWDTDGDKDVLAGLPTDMEIPANVTEGLIDEDEIVEAISDYLTDQTGFCHEGFELRQGY